MTKAGRRLHIARVKSLPCVLCKHMGLDAYPPSDAHHIREGQGAAQRAQDVLTVALCKEHHQGATGFHGLGKKGFYTRYKLDELDLLAMTLEALEE